ncbi:YhgE/Pip domain-containing protein [Oceanobacillus alkalisoli]|uniref:YhgE/Pip domain-containing protein n=1 Tax=Oceanobacillus alkalisoli TaxID=2925113 RepID=UPI001EE4648F|nr:YhgE/Pip domain-containing protein [Oceanobacillus alkalisoli]MCG5103879.1 YhgE/Pip domain-containing protein [Oceanobacillus alkalisoli]
MKNIWEIFKTDINNIRKKRAAIVVIVALMILPSMYAWFNILPSWDPYANTENVAVAVVNLDVGAEVEGKPINVGDEVITSLQDNNQLGWHFVAEEEAAEGLEKGDYYASIIIPANFSEKLTSVLDDEPEKPILDYYINEKVNAIAPKVTNAGATGIVESVHQGFIKVANEAIFNAFNDAGIELEANKENIERLRDAIYQLEEDMPEIERLLGVAEEDLDKAEDASEKAHEGIKKAEEVSVEVQALSERAKEILNETDQYVNEYVPIVKNDLATAQTVINEVPEIINQISEKEDSFDDVVTKIENSTAKIDQATEVLHVLEEALENADEEATDSERIANLIAQLEEDDEQLERTKQDLLATIDMIENAEDYGEDTPIDDEKSLEQLKAMVEIIEARQEAIQHAIEASKQVEESIANGIFLDGAEKVASYEEDLRQFKVEVLAKVAEAEAGKAKLADVLAYIDEQSKRINATISDLLIFIDNDLMPTYTKEMSTARNAIDEADKKIEKVVSYFPRVEEILTKIDAGIDTGKKELDKIHTAFPEAKDKILDLAKKTRELESKGDIAELINFLRNDPNAESEFFADPIVLEEHELFPIPNYGSAMAPFFTALALWVGGLILVSSLIVDIPNKHKYKSYEAYFGRFLTFWSIGIVQALVVTCGNMFLLKTYVLHKLLFVIFAILISTAFIVIIYTLVSVFGNTGKVIAIILLVMQLGASGGTFPIQTTPNFFQKIHQFMPFTHGLGLLREATGGIVWSVTLMHIAWLVGYIAVFLFIGIKLKEIINKRSDKFLEEARESKVIL